VGGEQYEIVEIIRVTTHFVSTGIPDRLGPAYYTIRTGAWVSDGHPVPWRNKEVRGRVRLDRGIEFDDCDPGDVVYAYSDRYEPAFDEVFGPMIEIETDERLAKLFGSWPYEPPPEPTEAPVVEVVVAPETDDDLSAEGEVATAPESQGGERWAGKVAAAPAESDGWQSTFVKVAVPVALLAALAAALGMRRRIEGLARL